MRIILRRPSLARRRSFETTSILRTTINMNQMIRAGGLLLRIAERDLLRMLKNEGLPQYPSVPIRSVGLGTPTPHSHPEGGRATSPSLDP